MSQYNVSATNMTQCHVYRRHESDQLSRLRYQSDQLSCLRHQNDPVSRRRHQSDQLSCLRHQNDPMSRPRHQSDQLSGLHHYWIFLLPPFLSHSLFSSKSSFPPYPFFYTFFALGWLTWNWRRENVVPTQSFYPQLPSVGCPPVAGVSHRADSPQSHAYRQPVVSAVPR